MDKRIATLALAVSLLGLTSLQVDAQVTRGASALATRADTYDAMHRSVAATYDAPGDPV